MSVTLLLSFLLSLFANQASYTAIDNPADAQCQIKSENLRKIITDDDGGWYIIDCHKIPIYKQSIKLWACFPQSRLTFVRNVWVCVYETDRRGHDWIS